MINVLQYGYSEEEDLKLNKRYAAQRYWSVDYNNTVYRIKLGKLYVKMLY